MTGVASRGRRVYGEGMAADSTAHYSNKRWPGGHPQLVVARKLLTQRGITYEIIRPNGYFLEVDDFDRAVVIGQVIQAEIVERS